MPDILDVAIRSGDRIPKAQIKKLLKRFPCCVLHRSFWFIYRRL